MLNPINTQPTEQETIYYTNGITHALNQCKIPFTGLRLYNLTETTDDPGNTELFLCYVSFPEIYCPDPDSKQIDWLNTELHKSFSSDGDHHEEILITFQNSELLLIINNNK